MIMKIEGGWNNDCSYFNSVYNHGLIGWAIFMDFVSEQQQANDGIYYDSTMHNIFAGWQPYTNRDNNNNINNHCQYSTAKENA